MAGRRSTWWAIFFSILALHCGRTQKNGDAGAGAGAGAGAEPGAGPGEDPVAPQCAVTLASDGDRYCAAYEDGSVWCWGIDPEPSRVSLPGKAYQLFMGAGNACAAVSGTLYCWGDNAQQQLRDEPGPVDVPLAVELGTDRAVHSAGIDSQHLCAVDVLMHLYCRGGAAGSPQQVELGGTSLLTIPGSGTAVVDAQGQIFALTDPQRPELLDALGDDNALITSGFGAPLCLLKRSGSLWCSDYVLTETPPLRPHLELGESVVSATVGDLFVCALTDSGRVWCEGWNPLGQTGRGTSVFAEGDYVPDITDALELAVTRGSACVLRRDGTVWCWGSYAPNPPTVAPREVTGCENQSATLSQPSRPAPRASRRLEEAGRARAQALCECAFGAPASDSCLAEESGTPNAKCVEALAPDHPASACEADRLWQEAQCYAASSADCNAGAAPGNCPTAVACPGDTHWSATARYCQRRSCLDGGDSIPPQSLCDGTADCADGSDERNCTPGQTWFDCDDSQRVPLRALCDDVFDCDNQADELGCRP